MSNTVGVVTVDSGFNWACGCGQTGTPTADREAAREAFKQHRQTCTHGKTAPAAPTPAAPQQSKTPPSGGATKMSTKGKKDAARPRTAKKDSKPRERAVSEKEAQSIFEKLKADKSTVMAEARRLGCYHATLRKSIRAAVGEAAYAKVMNGKRGKKGATKSTPKRKPATKKAEA